MDMVMHELEAGADVMYSMRLPSASVDALLMAAAPGSRPALRQAQAQSRAARLQVADVTWKQTVLFCRDASRPQT
eukprot:8039268-Alexandrium_andersonii.AAC.1